MLLLHFCHLYLGFPDLVYVSNDADTFKRSQGARAIAGRFPCNDALAHCAMHRWHACTSALLFFGPPTHLLACCRVLPSTLVWPHCNTDLQTRPKWPKLVPGCISPRVASQSCVGTRWGSILLLRSSSKMRWNSTSMCMVSGQAKNGPSSKQLICFQSFFRVSCFQFCCYHCQVLITFRAGELQNVPSEERTEVEKSRRKKLFERVEKLYARYHTARRVLKSAKHEGTIAVANDALWHLQATSFSIQVVLLSH